MKKHLLLFIPLFFTTLLLCKAQTPMLWGMTSNGGTYSLGNIFTCTLSGTVTDVYDFGAGADGTTPMGSLIQASNGLLYGLTQSGGDNSHGIMFSYNISTGVETVLHSFANGTDGEDPTGTLYQASNGLIYGITASGGSYINGTLFSYNIATSTYTVLYSFGNTVDNDGINPHGALVQVGDSLLYGTTVLGGTNGEGAIFSFNIFTHKEKVLHNFLTYPYESAPTGTLILGKDGLLYGITYAGGTVDDGVIYSFNTVTDSVTSIYSIGANTNDGYNPLDALIQAGNGLLYGMTVGGGAYHVGVIFSCDATTGNEIVLHSFGEGDGGITKGPDGVEPNGSLIQASNGLLYGMTETGGVIGDGTIFSYDITADTETNIHNFMGIDGIAPYGSLLEVDTPNSTLGIKQLTVESGQLTVYPNPTSGIMTISSTKNINNITVTNLVGQIILAQPAPLSLGEGPFANGTNPSYGGGVTRVIDLSNFSAGMYFITVTTDTATTTQKIAVQR